MTRRNEKTSIRVIRGIPLLHLTMVIDIEDIADHHLLRGEGMTQVPIEDEIIGEHHHPEYDDHQLQKGDEEHRLLAVIEGQLIPEVLPVANVEETGVMRDTIVERENEAELKTPIFLKCLTPLLLNDNQISEGVTTSTALSQIEEPVQQFVPRVEGHLV